ncbi:MAG: hypothetical protein QHH10_10915 [Peptococcaceae bacterium]|jgi:predicted nuclease with TOPRIM domain|nr:hypothetical protein [Peptococcaceae bacterium]MDH7525810.1 hypothetical protein [Peptococcaceae bacterium]
MEIGKIAEIIDRMRDNNSIINKRMLEKEDVLKELARVQQKLASLEQDILRLNLEQQRLDVEIRPLMADYLQSNVWQDAGDDVLA